MEYLLDIYQIQHVNGNCFIIGACKIPKKIVKTTGYSSGRIAIAVARPFNMDWIRFPLEK